jgi:hypothetical protein
VVLSSRQTPVEHACRGVPHVLEAVHHVARDEDNSAGSDRRGLAADGELISALDDKEYVLTFISRPKGVMSNACSGLTMMACRGECFGAVFCLAIRCCLRLVPWHLFILG